MTQDKQSNSKLELAQKVENSLISKQYGIYNHSGVQICTWNKKALTKRGVCYKEKLYGVDCHKCMQFSPVVMWCQQNCTFCWRPMEYMKNVKINIEDVDNPKEIISNLVEKRKKLISGFGGHKDVDFDKLKESVLPNHYAISLSGEPTLYPKLNEMVQYLKTLINTKTIFIVSNGQEPQYFKTLINDENSQPTQLYVSIDAPNKELFNKINRSLYKDGWERLNETLEHFSKIKCRRVYRITQIKGLNDLDEFLQLYKDLIEKGKPDLVEIKGYTYLGLSRKRHTVDQMPKFSDVKTFAKKLCDTCDNYEIVAEVDNSLIVVLRRKNSEYGLKIEKFENMK